MADLIRMMASLIFKKMHDSDSEPSADNEALTGMKRVFLFAASLLFAVVAVTAATMSQRAKARPLGPFDVSPLETQVLGQSRWLRGGPASLRVVVIDHETDKSVWAKVSISLAALKDGKPTTTTRLFSGHTNELGSLDAQFKAPTTPPGQYELKVSVDSQLGPDEVKQAIQLEESERILLTCDKPVYQPGQTVHLRALALDMATREPVKGQHLTFEVEDARGNKVFKNRQALSDFGVVGADFVLADEVNMGTFTLRAVLPSGQAEKKVRVERYVLPKFKVAVSTERPYYQPGELVKGTVQTDYFFGKPVAKGQVSITVNTIDIGVSKLAELRGTTDETGAFKFEYKLPTNFIGQPFEQGKAVVEFQTRVTDTAEHLQMQSKSVPVVKDPIMVAVAPESKNVVPNLPNRLYVACATPDGSPVVGATVKVDLSDRADQSDPSARTDAMGMAVVEYTPKTGPLSAAVTANSLDGHSGTTHLALPTDGGPAPQGILLRSTKTLAKVGEKIDLATFSTIQGGTVYFDVIRNKQTILTRSTEARKGVASLRLPVTDDMVGTVEVHAYKILPDENIVRDTRTLVISPADDLVIRANTDKAVYRPGEDAVVRFTVKDQANRGVASAIGLAIVDESVFALSELQPGLEKVYFMLERELMEPKYEIHGLRATDLVLNGGRRSVGASDLTGGRRSVGASDRSVGAAEAEAQRQRAATMLFTAVPVSNEFDYRANTWQTRWFAVREKAAEVMVAAHTKLQACSQKYAQDNNTAITADQGLQALVDRRYALPKEILDPWGRPYRLELFGQKVLVPYFGISSSGPDGKWGTIDDILNIQQYYRSNTRFRGGFGGGGAGFAGGRGGGLEMEDRPLMREFAAAPMAMAMGAALEQRMLFGAVDNLARDKAKADGKSGGASAEPRVRQYFPETMYWNPAIITDGNGRAEVRIPVADTITTWRMSMLANGASGQLGSATAPLKVFQDFFADIDLPVSLTQNDRVEIPVAVYNYLPGEQEVVLDLEERPWFKLEGPAKQTVHMAKNQVKVVYFPITVTALGNHTMKVTARGRGEKSTAQTADALMRTIEVTPDGKAVRTAINDRLDKEIEKKVSFPANAIAGANSLWVKLYPGTFGQVVEGLDGLLRMPNGCFEQTSSTTYPNVLVTDYMKTTKKINPELQMKAEQYINVGYQRLVTFECKGGGFSWFGDGEGHQILTAYGILQFSDMAKVHEVDPALISRTQNWLAGRQKADGTWPEDKQGIAEGIINRQTGALRNAAYIGWALAESGYKGPQIAKAVGYVKEHAGEVKDAYTLAIIVNLMAKTEKDGEFTARMANRLVEMAKQNDKTAWWEGDTQTFTGAQKGSADLETTGLAAYGLAKYGRNSGFLNKALTYLVNSKDSYGTWTTTQGTVWSMKALLYASSNSSGGSKGTVTVWANGAKAATFNITPEDSDVMRQVDLKETIKPTENQVKLTYTGEGSLLYQIVSRCYVPWEAAAQTSTGPLSIDVAYDKTTLAENDTASVTVTVKNNTNKVAEMPLIDLGIPPGFSVEPAQLDQAVKEKRVSKYTLAARQIIVYLEKLDPGGTLKLHYDIRAKYPIKARVPVAKVYPYYNPEQIGVSKPRQIVVKR